MGHEKITTTEICLSTSTGDITIAEIKIRCIKFAAAGDGYAKPWKAS